MFELRFGFGHLFKINKRTIKIKKGFTLIELLVVVAIIGILAAVGTIGFNQYIEGSQQKTTEVNRNTIARKVINDDMGMQAQMKDSKTCYEYLIEDVINSNDDIHDNAYNSDDTQSWVNGHATNEFNQGQHLIYCAHPAEPFKPDTNPMMICSCTKESGCIAGGSVCPTPTPYSP